MNYELALAAVDEWLTKLQEWEASRNSYGLETLDTLDDWFTQRQPMIVQIAATAYSARFATGFNEYAQASHNKWSGTRTAALKLRGVLQQREERQLILGRPGPKLDADRLHQWVWDAARTLWADKHYRPAVANAATSIETHLRAKLGRQDVSGTDLVTQAFTLKPASAGRPRLRFPKLNDPTSQRYTSAHNGAMHLGQGCFEGIRNWAAHSVDDEEKQVALEYLAALSVFARWVDEAVVESL